MIKGNDIELAKIHGRKIVDAIAAKRYSEIESLVDDMVNWDILLLEEVIEGTLAMNELPDIDKSNVKSNFNPVYKDGLIHEQERIYEYTDGSGLGYEHDFTVGGGEPFPELTLSLNFIYTKDGNMKVVFDSGIEPG